MTLLREQYARLEAKKDFRVEDIADDTVINAIWYELLRFLNPALYTYKVRFTKNAKIAGYRVRKGDYSTMFVSSSASYRKEGDLSKFDHTRFLDSKRKRFEENYSAPFSFGNRSCLGQKSALITSKLFVYLFLKNFDVAPDNNAVYDVILKVIPSV